MSTPASSAETNGVILLRLGVGDREFTLPPGSTLADLLHAAGADAQDQEILIDGRRIEEALILKPGTVVSLVPRPPSPRATISAWRETVGMFEDDPAFNEMVEAGRAIREAEREAAGGADEAAAS